MSTDDVALRLFLVDDDDGFCINAINGKFVSLFDIEYMPWFPGSSKQKLNVVDTHLQYKYYSSFK